MSSRIEVHHDQAAARAARFPLDARLTLAELDRFDNAALLASLRENEPVTWFAEQGGRFLLPVPRPRLLA